MQELQMTENENEFKCREKHNSIVNTILIDHKLNKKERFLCQECLDNQPKEYESLAMKAMQKIIEEKQIQKRKIINVIADSYIQIIQQYHNNLENFKTKLIQSIDILINVMQNWITELNQQKQDSNIYSFLNESDDYIRNRIQYMNTFSFDFFDKINYSQFIKLKIGIKQLIEAHNINQYKEFIKKLREINEKRKQLEQVQWQLSKDGNIKLNQLNNPIKQDQMCQALAFNSKGNILITSNNREIIIWNFNQGKLHYCQKYQLENIVNCLVFSKYQNIFISGSSEIYCWKEQQKNKWEKSNPYQYSEQADHPGITCLVLNSKEDQLIQGNRKESINIWEIDFQLNQLKYLYSIKQNSQWVSSLSLNNSENLLVSCGYNNETLIWKKEQDNKWNFMSEVIKFQKCDDPCKALFVKDDQFVWLSGNHGSNCLFIYQQQKKKDFTKIYEIQFHTIPNKKNKLYQTFDFKPEMNLLFIRYREYIYILRKQENNGQYKIAYEQCYQTNEIYGTLSNNGQYLVIFDQNTKSYNTYELQTI